ncbi:MAG: PD-(D/E)XK nuclease family protein [Bacteroidales bacterium]|jgi:RecB family exonuclease|nr:PD-(D/E)XK nuclease family protein [Bacteroidales bacterium]
MQDFLYQVATYLKKQYESCMSQICVVFPGKRSAFFLEQRLNKVLSKGAKLPKMFSIEDFWTEITQLTPACPEEQLCILYQIHLQINSEKSPLQTEDLSDFSGTGILMLKDFEDIDNQLVNPKSIFSSLSTIKELSFYDKREEELTEFQKKYLQFFKQLEIYYLKLQEKLLTSDTATLGLMSRMVAENPSKYISKLPYKKYIFVGFNALTKAEMTFITYLRDNQLLDYLIDADKFYLENPLHEAGDFIRKIKEKLFFGKEIQFIGNYFSQNAKNITFIGVPEAIGQAKILESVLASIPAEDANASTAIVNLDENLLLPILHSMDTAKANITMGYPLQRTSCAQMLSILLLSISNRKSVDKEGHYSLYFRDLSAFLTHPCIENLLSESEEKKLQIKEIFLQNEKIYCSVKDFEKMGKEAQISQELWNLLTSVLYQCIDFEGYCKNLRQLLHKIYETLSSGELEKEAMYQLENHISLIQSVLTSNMVSNFETFRFIFEYSLRSLSLPFESMPDAHLQILGLLETRTLDFQNIIVLSANEGILPAGKRGNSLLPYDVRRYYQLPVYHAIDSITAYHFYRLLQRSKNIYLVYNLDTTENKTEKSRFLLQLQNELQHFDNVNITDKMMTYPFPQIASKICLDIPKTAEIVQKLQKFVYSASSINTFLKCGRWFYFQYLLKIRSDSVFDETHTLQSNVIGNAVHHVLQHAVKDGKFIPLSKQDIENQVSTFLKNQHNVPIEELQFEKNHLIFSIIVKYIADYLDFTMKNGDFTVEETEQKYDKTKLQIEGTEISLKAIIDRVDIVGNQRIISDYKTGEVNTDVKIKSLDDVFDGKHDKALQLLFYAFVYCREKSMQNIETQIIALRKMSQKFILQINEQSLLTAEILDEFEQSLTDVITHILSPNEPFSPTNDDKLCNNCTYKKMCGK